MPASRIFVCLFQPTCGRASVLGLYHLRRYNLWCQACLGVPRDVAYQTGRIYSCTVILRKIRNRKPGASQHFRILRNFIQLLAVTKSITYNSNLILCKMADCKSAHLAQVHDTWMRLQKQRDLGKYELNGRELDIADVVATA
jgi:hypothetical protein